MTVLVASNRFPGDRFRVSEVSWFVALFRLRLDLLRLLAELHELGLGLDVVAEVLVYVLLDAAAGVAAGGALLGVGNLDVGVYGVDHRLLVGGEGGAGFDIPAGDALMAHPAEPRAA